MSAGTYLLRVFTLFPASPPFTSLFPFHSCSFSLLPQCYLWSAKCPR